MKWNVDIDYPSECICVEADTKEEAESKALEMIGEVTFRAEKDCTAEATPLFDNEDGKEDE